ncbi:hypothetical protein E1J38_004330 [Seonamhaeicola sediminis]|uniref:DUF4175 family protein n=1 Tax=Seonamhaeicola sediminis TaxID=2528206 RepID=A0A562YGW5_9FLAO|nr:DUF4175 family protein [Seonamhaeicola sediminis]TWO34011.1 hypothetical protein E1J38_004330 [Seonamhaeicola sediminis]
MNNFKKIQNKLEGFIKRYYTNELLKGAILFFAIGLLYFLFTLFIEYALWLGTGARAVLFWLFIAVELALLVKFIVIPIAKLFKLKTGIDYKDASRIIGNHFPEVNDKLLNVLQLNENTTHSELLLASIEQKSLELKPIPFKLAINFKQNVKYLKYAAIPVLILVITFLTDNLDWFSNSYNRVVHYKTEYQPPAPFQFFVVNDKLQTIENKDFTLVVKTVGDLIPETVQIEYDNEVYFLHQTGIGEFEYVFTQPKTVIDFVLSANNVTSKPYVLEIIEAPSLLGFEMFLDYPNYTKKNDESLKSTGNAIVPEGTSITWKFKTKSTDFVNLYTEDTLKLSMSNKGVFEASRRVLKNLDYSVSTSNNNLKDYENLAFRIDVVKDQYPELNIKMQLDTLDLETMYFYGQVTDDYGFHKLQLVYYPSNSEEAKQVENIPISNSNVSEFISVFPNNLEIQEGVSYNLFFQVFDNDIVNNYKSIKSSICTYRKRTKEEEVQKQLNDQSKTIKDLNKSFKKFEEQEKTLEELSKIQKEKPSLNFNDKKKLESFLKRQKQQDQMMKNFNKKFKENLEQFQEENIKDEFKEDLKSRLEDNEEQLKKDEKLLEELEKLKEKISKEELVNKLEELAKQNKNKKRSLEQLLELTKRFYIEKKLEKLAEDLDKLSEEQEQLSKENNKNNTPENQEKLNKKFDDFTKELEDLNKDNDALNKPMEIPQDRLEENEIKKEQQQATDDLKKSELEKRDPSQEGQKNEGEQNQEQQSQSKQNAQKNQKNAAKKMKQMAKSMQSSMNASGGEQMQEDMEMLRQILDNLVLYSFDQEGLMDNFKRVDINHSKFANYLKKQQVLKEHFEHIDDSLFALSLRQPKLSETVNKEISEVYFNIDKAMELLAENQLYQGIGSQQFAVTSANNLADFLSDILDNMQESLSMSPGKGKGDMQLPDIIMSQEQLQKMMEEGIKKSQEGQQQKEGEENKGEKSNEKSGQRDSDNGKGGSEELNGLLFEIYQQQQQLRQALNEKIAKQGLGSKANSLVRKMEDIELELLNKGFTNSALKKMMELKHQLLKLENATFEQGEDEKRQSKTNDNQFNNNSNNLIPKAKQYFNTIEILDKQALPLQQIYKKKVQEYFKTSDD